MKISNMKMLPISNANSNWELATLALATLATLATLTSFALPLTWRADWPDAKPVETLVHRGTDVELRPLWRINKELADTNGWTFTTYCQTNAVGPWFGPLPGAFFSHTNDVGAAFYNVIVRAETPSGEVNYTAFARLRMLDSPGFAPGVLPLPTQTLDFADITVFNAPYYTKAETDERIVALAPVPGDYETVSDRAMRAVTTNANGWVEADIDLGRHTLRSGRYGGLLVPGTSGWRLTPAEVAPTDETFLFNWIPIGSPVEVVRRRDLAAAATASTNYTDAAVAGKLDTEGSHYAFRNATPGLTIDSVLGSSVRTYVFAKPGYEGDPDTVARLSDIPESVTPETVTNIVCGTVTNGVRTGFTAWEYSGDITPGVKYDISSEGDAPPFTFRLWNRNTETEVSSVTDASANPTELTFEVAGGSILANRLPIYKYSLGLASEGAVKRLDQRIDGVDAKVDAVSNDVVTVSNRLETIDTSYWHYSITTGDENVTIANRNQSVTTLISTSAVPSTLHIQIPQEEAMTKDWLIYVFPSTNIVLSLEAATYYVSDASVTNDITSATALYFSQVNPGVYTLGRKEFTAIVIQNPVEATVSAALQRNSRRAYIK